MGVLEHVIDPVRPGRFGSCGATPQVGAPEGLVVGLLRPALELGNDVGAEVLAAGVQAALLGLLSSDV
eukprot:9245167-Alexandrium_andersonii.AAC.1